jgi:hypothetical protein
MADPKVVIPSSSAADTSAPEDARDRGSSNAEDTIEQITSNAALARERVTSFSNEDECVELAFRGRQAKLNLHFHPAHIQGGTSYYDGIGAFLVERKVPTHNIHKFNQLVLTTSFIFVTSRIPRENSVAQRQGGQLSRVMSLLV